MKNNILHKFSMYFNNRMQEVDNFSHIYTLIGQYDDNDIETIIFTCKKDEDKIKFLIALLKIAKPYAKINIKKYNDDDETVCMIHETYTHRIEELLRNHNISRVFINKDKFKFLQMNQSFKKLIESNVTVEFKDFSKSDKPNDLYEYQT